MTGCARGLLSSALLAMATMAIGQCPGVRPKFSWASDGSTIVFTDLTQAYVSERHWEFGDGDTAMGLVETHTYAFAADDTVTLTVTVDGCPFSVSGRVVHPGQNDACLSQLTSAFTVEQAGNNHMLFTDQSEGDGSLLLYLWTFGDDSLWIGQSAEHFYALPGAYDVSHSIGTVDSLFQTACVAGSAERVYVNGNTSTCDSSLFLDLNLGDGMGVLPFEAQIAVLDGALVIAETFWDYGDGTSDVGISATHAYAYPGEYQVCVQVNAFDTVAQQECFARACDVVVPQLVGLAENSPKAEFDGHPVPCEDALWLSGPGVRRGAQWSLFDALGRVVTSGPVEHDGAERLELGTVPGGMYTVVLFGKNGVYSLRIVKQ